MDRIRVMLADDNRSMLKLLSDYLGRMLDIIMPRRDGFMTLEKLSEPDFPVKPKVIVLTGLARDDFIMRAIRLGASYYMVKPFDMNLLYARLREIAGEPPSPVAEAAPEDGEGRESVDEQITNLFLTLGIPAHIKGYQYLREAVRMVLENHDVINRITKELYPGIARKFDTSASKVERAMRHAIEVAWTRGRLDAVNQMYGYRVFAREDKPTNGEFIAMVSDKLAVKKTA